MEKHRVARLIRLLLPAVLMMTFADRAQAAAILLLGNVEVLVGPAGTTAEVRGDVQAHSDDAADLFVLEFSLDSLTVGLSENGGPPAALIGGTPALDDTPFLFGLPATLLAGETLTDRTLFFLGELVPGSNYQVTIDIGYSVGGQASLDPAGAVRDFTASAAVPEPGSLLLVVTGGGLLYRQRRKRTRLV
jgi:hypothetical protein